jgi:hypothetical protein
MGENISTLTIPKNCLLEEMIPKNHESLQGIEQLAEGKMMLATWLNLMWTGDSLIRTVSYSPGRLIGRWF